MKFKRVVFDADGVLLNIYDHLELHMRESFKDFKKEDIEDWDFETIPKERRDLMFSLFKKYSFMSTISTYPNIFELEGLKKSKNGFVFEVNTHVMCDGIDDLRKELFKTFLFEYVKISYDGNKEIGDAFVYVEDRYENLLKNPQVPHRILVTQPHNRFIEELEPGIVRVPQEELFNLLKVLL